MNRQWQIKKLVSLWFRKITYKAPVEELLRLLSRQNLIMEFPEATLTSHSEFKNWYVDVTGKFFDQKHELKMIDVVPDDQGAEVNLQVNWQTRLWQPPQAFSRLESYDIYQIWQVVNEAGQYVIKEYHVREVEKN